MSVLSLSYWESDVYWRQNNKHFAELAPQNGRKQLIWRNYVTVTLCIVIRLYPPSSLQELYQPTPNSLWRARLMGVIAYFSNSGVISSDPAAFPFRSLLNWSVLWDSYVWSTCGCTILKVSTQTCRRMVQSSLIIFYTLLGGLFYCLA